MKAGMASQAAALGIAGRCHERIHPHRHHTALHQSALLRSSPCLLPSASASPITPLLFHFSLSVQFAFPSLSDTRLTHSTAISSRSAKLDSPSAVPALSYSPAPTDRWRGSAGSTPVQSPRTPISPLLSRRSEREQDLYFSWFRKPPSASASNRFDSFVENEDLPLHDLEHNGHCLFSPLPAQLHTQAAMAVSTPPIDISPAATFGSSSPRNQTSNLTSALQGASAMPRHSPAITLLDQNTGEPNYPTPRDDSGPHGLPQYTTGAQPIAMAERPRKESFANSLVNGSWGGVSVGSWIRDE